MTEVGFTGSQRGMTDQQQRTVRALLHAMGVAQPRAHHGDCIGADAQFHALARAAGYYVVVHPPSDPAKRARCTGDELWPARPYLRRNDDIVACSEVLIAAPAQAVEQLRSGTWSTVRRARRLEVPVYLVPPDGPGALKNAKRPAAHGQGRRGVCAPGGGAAGNFSRPHP